MLLGGAGREEHGGVVCLDGVQGKQGRGLCACCCSRQPDWHARSRVGELLEPVKHVCGRDHEGRLIGWQCAFAAPSLIDCQACLVESKAAKVIHTSQFRQHTLLRSCPIASS
jgi:hypothetical protein